MRPVAIDGGEAKKKLCLSLGAEAFVDFTQTQDVAAEVVKIADGVGAHGVLVTAYQAYKGRSSTPLFPLPPPRWSFELTELWP